MLFFVELNKNNLEGTPVFHILKGKTPIGDDGCFAAEKRATEGGENRDIANKTEEKILL